MTRKEKRAQATRLWIVQMADGENDGYVAATYLERRDAESFADRLRKLWKQEYVVRDITPESAGAAWREFVRVAL